MITDENSPSLQFNMKLVPILRKDEETGFVIAQFRGFPQAIAYDSTEETALSRLVDLFKAMIKKEKGAVVNNILENERASLNINVLTA